MSGNGGAPGVEETVRDFWANRPRRPRRGRKIAGVAAGVGAQYGIDPVIVRVVFVVSAFYGGVGVLAYLLGWLFLPADDDEVSPVESLAGRGRSNTSAVLTVLLCLALFPAATFFLHNGVGAVIGLALIAAALYLLHRHRGQGGDTTGQAAGGAPTGPPPGVASDQPTAPVHEFSTEAGHGHGRPEAGAAGSGTGAVGQTTPMRQPPSWDPLGAAPFAWDLPEPGGRPEPPAEPEPRPRRFPVGLLTSGVALLVVGASVLVGQLVAGTWLTAPHVVGLVLGVLGLGMVAGSFLHGGRGLIVLAVPLSVAGFVLTAASLDHWDGAGDRVYTPTVAQQVLPSYHLSAGNNMLDLRQLTGDAVTRTGVDLGVGNAEVRVPENADVEVHCTAHLGNVDCLGHQSSGTNPRQDVTDAGPDGPGGPKLILDVHTGLGNVEVRRG
ncbi:PspC domain-containing protein [Gandjariella thermophila]|nr:PspC domain-containing protein [Gandjariella thermophila]